MWNGNLPHRRDFVQVGPKMTKWVGKKSKFSKIIDTNGNKSEYYEWPGYYFVKEIVSRNFWVCG